MKILVTGSSGFIGSHLTALLADHGHDIVGYDWRDPSDDFRVTHQVTADIRDKQVMVRALEGVDVVIHLAAIHFDYGHRPDEYWEGNEEGTRCVLESMSDARVDKLVFTSTIAVYGDRVDRVSEGSSLDATSPYGASKLAAEKLVESWTTAQPTRCATVIRPCAVYGERNITNMNNLIRQIDSNAFVVFGSGDNIKAIAYVGNLVHVLSYFAENCHPGVRTFNYSDQPDLTVNDIVRCIHKGLGKSDRVTHLPLWLGSFAASPFDLIAWITGKNLGVSRARVRKLALPTLIDSTRIREVGVAQRISSENGLLRTTQFYLQNKGR